MTPQPVRQLVQIEGVDILRRTASVRDKLGAPHAAVFRDADAVSQLPQVGEMWMAERISSLEWHLLRRRESPEESAIRDTMNPGDTIVRAGPKLYINGQEIDVDLNGDVDALLQVPGTFRIEVDTIEMRRIGSPSPAIVFAPTYQDRRVTSADTTSWALSFNPVHIRTVQLFDNGLLVDPAGLSITSGNTLNFPTIATGHTLVCYYQTLV